jgi:hypothetical protein
MRIKPPYGFRSQRTHRPGDAGCSFERAWREEAHELFSHQRDRVLKVALHPFGTAADTKVRSEKAMAARS